MKNFLFTGFIILLLSAVSCKTTEKGSMTQTQTPTSQTNEKKNISINPFGGLVLRCHFTTSCVT